ncbi:MAG: PilZ domain-containing protein [Porticoccaceae bacterium]|nr:PilZ domain-containing protein [Pseudomonadales bacterium]MCP5173045.1 PilZ domain-containing protein [Pseudomonadales bacterium]MCP5302519.1 PilZ domain-containing protein [Pseudomonadales bacterium]
MEFKTEKRSYYRINDLVGLSYKVISEDDPGITNPNDLGNSVVTLLAEIDREFNQLTNILWQENPTAARSMGLLNRKLAIVAGHAINGDQQTLADDDLLMVNISGSGIAFKCGERVPTGTRLLLTLTLKPSNIKLELTGQIVGCEENKTDQKKPFWLRVAFEENNGATQEQLIQHIVQKEYAQLHRSEALPHPKKATPTDKSD